MLMCGKALHVVTRDIVAVCTLDVLGIIKILLMQLPELQLSCSIEAYNMSISREMSLVTARRAWHLLPDYHV